MASSHTAVCPRGAALGDAARRAPLGESKRSSVPWGGRSRSARRVVTRAPTPRDVRVSVHTPPAHDSGVDDGLDVAEMRARLKQKQQALMEKLATRKELQMELREAVARKHPELINEVVPRNPAATAAAAAPEAPPQRQVLPLSLIHI